jgi:hypothetical protein
MINSTVNRLATSDIRSGGTSAIMASISARVTSLILSSQILAAEGVA